MIIPHYKQIFVLYTTTNGFCCLECRFLNLRRPWKPTQDWSPLWKPLSQKTTQCYHTRPCLVSMTPSRLRGSPGGTGNPWKPGHIGRVPSLRRYCGAQLKPDIEEKLRKILSKLKIPKALSTCDVSFVWVGACWNCFRRMFNYLE